MTHQNPADRFLCIVQRFTQGFQHRRYSHDTQQALQERLFSGEDLELITPWCESYVIQVRYDQWVAECNEPVESIFPLLPAEIEVFRRFARVYQELRATIPSLSLSWYVVPSPSTNPEFQISQEAAEAYTEALETALSKNAPDVPAMIVSMQDMLPEWFAYCPSIPSVLSEEDIADVIDATCIPLGLFHRFLAHRTRQFTDCDVSIPMDVLRAQVLRQLVLEKEEGRLYAETYPNAFFALLEEVSRYDPHRLGYPSLLDRLLCFLPVAPWRG